MEAEIGLIAEGYSMSNNLVLVSYFSRRLDKRCKLFMAEVSSEFVQRTNGL